MEEVMGEFQRQLKTWNELNHKSYTFLQMNGLILSVIFIALSIEGDKIGVLRAFFLLLGSIFIIISMIVVICYGLIGMQIKEIKVELDDDAEPV